MGGCKGVASIAIVGLIVAVCAVAGIVSTHYLGTDNPVEEELEVVAEDVAEKEFKLAPGTLKPEADLLFPHKQDTNK